MFITSISTDNWFNGNDEGQIIMNDISWSLVKETIEQLDGKTKTMVTLGIGDEEVPNMIIGGGNSGLYVVTATFDNEMFYNLIDTEKSEENEVWIVTGGQRSNFSENYCVSLDKVLQAAKTFAENGKIEESLEWEEQ